MLWELTRHVLVWYFATLSQIGTVYGSLTSAIVVLLSFELASTLLLFGAQVIAEYERIGRHPRRHLRSRCASINAERDAASTPSSTRASSAARYRPSLPTCPVSGGSILSPPVIQRPGACVTARHI